MSKERSDDQEDIKCALRKLRKKLRQIENLEKLTRPLTPEEIAKINSKDGCRDSLQNFLVLADQFDVSASEISSFLSDNVGSVNILANDSNTGPVIISEEEEEEENTSQISLCSSEQLLSECEPLQVPELPPATAITSASITTTPVETVSSCLKESDPTEQRKRKRESSRKLERQKLSEFRKKWSQCKFLYFDGHDDKICCLASNSDTVVSGSKDTTCKVWDRHSGTSVYTLGDHTSAVTGVFVLGDKILTTSYDCKLRKWDKLSGKLEHSHYLYSPITCAVEYRRMLLIGTEGGKIIYYCTETFSVKWEAIAHPEIILSLALNETTALSASNASDLCVWKISEGKLMETSVNIPVTRSVRCMVIHQEKLYFGDDGVNIKVFNFEAKTLDKLKNHDSDYGSTDALMVYDDSYLISSSYNLDTGKTSINFRLLLDHSYLFSVQCPVSGPITCMSRAVSRAVSRDDIPELFCGGSDFGVITQSEEDSEQTEAIEVVTLAAYRDRYSDSLSESSDDEESEVPRKTKRTEVAEEDPAGSWCTIS